MNKQILATQYDDKWVFTYPDFKSPQESPSTSMEGVYDVDMDFIYAELEKVKYKSYELKPCPFCGKAGEIWYDESNHNFFHGCLDCGVSFLGNDYTEWNTRANEDNDCDKKIKQLVELISEYIPGFDLIFPVRELTQEEKDYAKTIFQDFLNKKNEK